MRWADIDMLRHVNNVTYAEYAAEAQALLGSELPAAGLPSEVTVRFAAPMLISRTPVSIVTSIDADVVTQEIGSGETVNAHIVSRFGAVPELSFPDGAEGPADVRVRIGDVDQSGRVTVPKLFELTQETRILAIAERLAEGSFGQFVVGTVTLQLASSPVWREEPYQTRGWISRVGNGSFTVESVLLDGDVPLVQASSILVGFDLDTQKSRPFTEREKAALRDPVDREVA